MNRTKIIIAAALFICLLIFGAWFVFSGAEKNNPKINSSPSQSESEIEFVDSKAAKASFVYKVYDEGRYGNYYLYQNGQHTQLSAPQGRFTDLIVEDGNILEISDEKTIYVYNQTLRKHEKIVEVPNKVFQTMLSKDGNKLAYFDVTKEDPQEVDLYVLDRTKNTSEKILHLKADIFSGFSFGSWQENDYIYAFSGGGDAGTSVESLFRLDLTNKSSEKLADYMLESYTEGTNGELIEGFTSDSKVVTLFEKGNSVKPLEKIIKETNLKDLKSTEVIKLTNFLEEGEDVYESINLTYDPLSGSYYYGRILGGSFDGKYEKTGVENLGFYEVKDGQSSKVEIELNNLDKGCSANLEAGNDKYIVYTNMEDEVGAGTKSEVILYSKDSKKKITILKSDQHSRCYSGFYFLGWLK